MGRFNKKTTFELAAIDKLTAPFTRMRKATEAGTKTFKETSSAIKELHGVTGKIKNYEKAIESSDKLSEKLEQQKLKVNTLAEALQNIKRPTRIQSEEFRKAQAKLDSLTYRFDKSKETIDNYKSSLKDLGVDTSKLSKEKEKLADKEERLNKILKKQGEELKRVRAYESAKRGFHRSVDRSVKLGATGYMAVDQGMGAFRKLTQPIKTGMDFEKSQSKVGAKLGLKSSSDEMQRLKKLAIDLGNTTQFSAAQVSSAQEKLAMSGVASHKINKEMLSSLLDISAAGDIDLADAASLSLSVLNSFEVPYEKLSDVTDILSYTANNANTDLEEMKYIFSDVGAVASGAGIELETVAGMITTLSSVGVKSSIAGTAIKNTLLNLASPSKDGAKALRDLGVSVHDANDKMLPLESIFKQINIQTKELTKAQKISLFKKIGGSDAVSGFTALVNKYTEFSKAEKDIRKNSGGSAKETAKIANDNMAGDVELLSSAWTGFSLVITDHLKPAFRELTQGLTGVIQNVTKFAEENPKAVKTVVGLGLGLSSLMIGGGVALKLFSMLKFVGAGLAFGMQALKLKSIGFFVSFGSGIKKALIAVRLFALGLTSTGIGGILVGLGLAAGAIWYNWDKIKESVKAALDYILPAFKSFTDKTSEIFEPMTNSVKSVFSYFWDDYEYEAPSYVKNHVLNPDIGKIVTPENTVGSNSVLRTDNNTVNAPITLNINGSDDPEKTGQAVKDAINDYMEGLQFQLNARLSD